jgi:cell wall assembly regulator SMI1
MKAIAAAWRRIEDTHKEHVPATYKALGRPATDDQIATLQRNFGRTLPGDLVASLRIHNGMRARDRAVALFDNQILLSTTGIAAAWQKRRDLFGGRRADGGGCPLTRTRKIRNDRRWNVAWVPITADEGDGFVVDLDPAGRGTVGQVFSFYHDGFRPREVVAASYGEWLQKLARQFTRGQFTVEEGSIWLLAGF